MPGIQPVTFSGGLQLTRDNYQTRNNGVNKLQGHLLKIKVS